jgi:hypothetical protein
MGAVPLDHLNRHLLAKQHLDSATKGTDVVQVVRDICALHATSPTSPYVSLWSRMRGLRRRDVHHALYESKGLARILCMRSTVHIVPSDELPIFFQATKDRLQRSFLRQARQWLIRSGLCIEGEEERMLQRLQQQVLDALTERWPSTVAELGQQVPELTARVKYAPDKPYGGEFSLGSRLVPGLCTLGLLVRGRPRGTWRSNLHTYAPLPRWLPNLRLDALTPQEARAALVRGYLAAFGPATFEDIAWWCGFSKAETRRALSAVSNDIIEKEIDHIPGQHLMLARDDHTLQQSAPCAEPIINLLPRLDPYVMGYRDRRRFLDPERHDKVFDRSGNAFATVWLDGRIVGVWQLRDTALTVLVWQDVPEDVLDAEARLMGGFLGYDDTPVVVSPYPEHSRVKNPFSITTGE